MRLNQFLAKNTDLSRRSADKAISAGRVEVNNMPAKLGDVVIDTDHVTLDSHVVIPSITNTTILLHKPVGFVCSRNGQGSQTVYDLLPAELHHLNPVGRLDKDSSGLVLLTNDGELANRLTHPRYEKLKIYEVQLDKPLTEADRVLISQDGVVLEDGISKLGLEVASNAQRVRVTMHEGRNRQIRRTFEALGYKVTKLHRTHFGDYSLGHLEPGKFIKL
jgi:23S rRNA pseudouridine2605 synthase